MSFTIHFRGLGLLSNNITMMPPACYAQYSLTLACILCTVSHGLAFNNTGQILHILHHAPVQCCQACLELPIERLEQVPNSFDQFVKTQQGKFFHGMHRCAKHLWPNPIYVGKFWNMNSDRKSIKAVSSPMSQRAKL